MIMTLMAKAVSRSVILRGGGWEGGQGCQLLHTLRTVCSTSHTAHHRALCDCDKSAQSRLERTQRIASAGARC